MSKSSGNQAAIPAQGKPCVRSVDAGPNFLPVSIELYPAAFQKICHNGYDLMIASAAAADSCDQIPEAEGKMSALLRLVHMHRLVYKLASLNSRRDAELHRWNVSVDSTNWGVFIRYIPQVSRCVFALAFIAPRAVIPSIATLAAPCPASKIPRDS